MLRPSLVNGEFVMASHVRILATLHIVFGGFGFLLGLLLFTVFGGIAGFLGMTGRAADAPFAAADSGSHWRSHSSADRSARAARHCRGHWSAAVPAVGPDPYAHPFRIR